VTSADDGAQTNAAKARQSTRFLMSFSYWVKMILWVNGSYKWFHKCNVLNRIKKSIPMGIKGRLEHLCYCRTGLFRLISRPFQWSQKIYFQVRLGSSFVK
jgi:hypothetical protein